MTSRRELANAIRALSMDAVQKANSGHNLSHYAVLDKCEKLVEAGLVESVKNDRNRVFQITEKGLGFFQEFKRFQRLVESMNLRY